ncbi:hypothetical protein GE09DRAFT_1087803 [Coniochaeta sp. 2T2.1]|nr:hypothetical protein GE09DRAFT_1087803 [Coniochaeta sp. 2T2.1]
MSLKERLALLQKQQLENAQRHADAVAKKEKPKRPAKKRMESHDGHGHAEEAEASAPAPPPPDRRDSEDVARKSIDEPHPPRVPHPTRRRSSKGPEPHDGNEADMSGAGETTEGQEDDHTEREDSDHQPKHIATAAKQDDERLDEEEVVDEEDEDEEEEEDDVDPEIRRKEELRARMARIAGGMGGMGGMGAIFGGGMPSGAAPAAPPKRKKSVAPEASEEAASPSTHAPPIPTMMALPGMSRVKSAEKAPPREEDESEEEEDEAELRTPHQESAPQFAPREAGGPPPVPSGRPAPPPVPTESRPPPPPAAVESESQGSQSDDELSERGAPGESAPAPSQATRAPPPLPPLSAPSPMLPTSPTTASSNRRSFIGDGAHPTSTTAGAPPPPPENRRNSRAPPPLPGAAPALSPNQSRPPPPPPPGALSRSSTADTLGPLSPTRQVPHAERLNEEEEVTEYEGDYDTDIASSAPHKDALKSHQRESSFEDNTSVRSPATEAPPSMPPPLPNTSAPRGPPPIPSQPPPETSRRSVDAPRAAPPPPPKEAPRYGDDDYDPFNYASPPPVPSVSHPPPPPPPSRPAEDPYVATSPYQSPPPDRRGPPPAPPSAAPAPPSRANTRQSLDVQRPAAGSSRRSVDVARPSMESGFVANELDLAGSSGWWLKPDSLPPQLQGRKDIYFESDESTSSNPRGKTIITRDIYVLYQDYSQTVITVRFDPHDATDVDLSQRHEAPPRTLRQDQLEQSYERFGRAIGDSVPSKQNTVIGDGTPQALIYDLLRPHRDALLPVGTRAYGALVYSNLANASTTQNDEIRPGDIISIRNAKFQGKHGPMHAKYSVEVGKPDHVGIVAEWDGTKKKVRAWEQGRESKKVKMESFKLDDLRSGEVKIWRVMPRSWVGWEGVGN